MKENRKMIDVDVSHTAIADIKQVQHMKITVHRQACCSQDDQIGPLEAEFHIDANASFGSLIQEIVQSGFLQFSSTHSRITGEVDGRGLVEIYSPDGVCPNLAEFTVNPSVPIIELLGERVLAFYFRPMRKGDLGVGFKSSYSVHERQQSESGLTVSFAAEIAATAELLRICDEDGRNDSYVHSIRSCLECLRTGNVPDAVNHFRCVPLGGMMRFDDWYPANASNAALFDAAVARWVQVMRPHTPRPRCACCGKQKHDGPCFEYLGK
jgi:hypothetical protein